MLEPAVFGRWLHRRRRALDLTQRELAARAGCSTATIRKLEADERRPSKRTATALARALDVPAEDTEAFVRFARRGWADQAPPSADAALERPWKVEGLSSDAGDASGAPAPRVGSATPGGPSGGLLAPDLDAELAAPPKVAVPGAPPARGREPGTRTHGGERFVAREAELAALRRALENAQAGRLTTVMVAGEAGHGKSALLRAFVANSLQRDPGIVVVTGSCNAYVGAGDPFLPFREVLSQLLGQAPAGGEGGLVTAVRASGARSLAPRARSLLAQHGPHLPDTLVPRRLLGPEAPSARVRWDELPASGFGVPEEALRSEVCAVLAAVAREVPLLLVLDDLHWVDRSSAELLLHLGRTHADARLLIAGAYRPSELAESAHAERHVLDVVLRELERRDGRVVLDLAGADARAFLDAYLDAEPNDLDATFREALWHQTAGQPLLTVELLRDLEERGDLIRGGDGRWRVAREILWDAMPDRVAGALAQRLARVDPHTLQVLRVASVEGTTFTPEVIARVQGADLARVVRSLGELAARHRLVSGGDLNTVGQRRLVQHRFRHDLIQRFVYGGLEAGERRYLHAAVAEALVSLHGEEVDPGVLVHHLRHGPAPERAAPHLRAVGDRARRSGALEEAIRHYRGALEMARAPSEAWRAGVLAALGECLWLRGRLAEARTVLSDARDAFIAVGDPLGAGTAELSLARVRFDQAEGAADLEAYHRALAMLEQLPEGATLARVLSCISQWYMVAFEARQAMSWGERALAIAERVGAEDVRVHAWNNIGVALAQSSWERRKEGYALLHRSLSVATDLGLVYDACRAGYNLGELQANHGEVEDARRTLTELARYAAQHQLFTMEVAGRLTRWKMEWRLGRWRWAFGQWRMLDGFITQAEPGSIKAMSIAVTLAGAELDLGRVAAAWGYLRPWLSALDDVEEAQIRAPHLRERLRHAILVGDGAAADVHARAIADLGTSGVPMFDSVAAGLRAVARWWSPVGTWPRRAPLGAEDRRRLDAVVAALLTARCHVGPAEGEATAWEARACQARSAGAAEEEAASLERAAAAWGEADLPLEEARAWRDAARALQAAGEVDRAGRADARADALVETLAGRIPDAATARVFRRQHARPSA